MIEQYAWFRDRFADALDPTWQDIDEIDEKVASGSVILWVAGDTALLTELRELPMGPVLFGLVCVGGITALIEEIQPAVETWACEHGCKGIAFCGRPGWTRALKDYRTVQAVALKEL